MLTPTNLLPASIMRFYLAPMADISTEIFRTVCYKGGADVCYSEMISAKAVTMNNKKTLRLSRIAPDEPETYLQLFGSDAKDFAAAVPVLEEYAHPAGFDINAGCPVKKVIKDGAGSVLMDKPETLRAIVAVVRKSTDLPISLKIRKGFLQPSYREIAHIAQEEGVDILIVHPRLRSEFFQGISDFSVSLELAETLSVPVVHSGDIDCFERLRLLENSALHGVMIGRAAMKEPWIFSELRGGTLSTEKKNSLIAFHFNAIASSDIPEKVQLITMKKHAAWYAAGRPGVAAFREQLFRSHGSVQETLRMIGDFLDIRDF